MSSELGELLGEIPSYDDPKEIELVEKIAEKTRVGKIVWEGTQSSLVASAPGMQISFVRSSPVANTFASILGGGWEMFSIRSKQGAEIMKVERPSSPLFGMPMPAPVQRGRLLEVVDTLYSLANSRGHGDIEKAINVIDNL